MTLQDLIHTLNTCGLDVPPDLPAAIISHGQDAVPYLADIVLADPDLAPTGETEGWAAIHAAVLLGAIGGLPAAEALAQLIRLDDKEDFLGDWLHTAVESALGFCGPDAWDLARDIAADESLGVFHRAAGASALQIITWKSPHFHEPTTACLTDLLNKTTDPDLAYLLTSILNSAVEADDRVRKAIDRVFDQKLIHPRFMTREDALEDHTDTPWEPFVHPKTWPDHFALTELNRLKEINESDEDEAWDEDIFEDTGWDDDELVERETWSGSQPIAETPTEELADALGACGINVYIDLPEELVRRGEEAVPALSRVIEDPRLAREERGRSWAPYHAFAILACIRSETAIPALMNSLKLLHHRPFVDWMVTASAAALANVGAAAFDKLESVVTDPAAEPLERCTSAQALYAHAALTVSARDRVEDILVNLFINDTDQIFRELLVNAISRMNTARARTVLKEYLRSQRATVTDSEREYYENRMALDLEWDPKEAAVPPAYRFSVDGLTEVAASVAHDFIRELAERGLLDDELDELEDLAAPRLPMRQPIKIGRNDPCPCGSGKKYKRCCGR